MSRYYKHGNGRIQMRQNNGRFRKSTLADLNAGVIVCPKCQRFNPWELYTFDRSSGFVEKKRNDPPTVCHACGASLKQEE